MKHKQLEPYVPYLKHQSIQNFFRNTPVEALVESLDGEIHFLEGWIAAMHSCTDDAFQQMKDQIAKDLYEAKSIR